MIEKWTGLTVEDTDHHFTIDPFTREITSKNPQKDVLIQNDHNSERFTFEIPRFIEGRDVAKCNEVTVSYTNGRSTGVYIVDDMDIYPFVNDIVTCSWLISQNATKNVGKLSFNIRFAQVNEDATVEYAWSTKSYDKVKVFETEDAIDRFVGEYVDPIQRWKNDVKAEMSAYVETTVENQVDVAQITTNKNDISKLETDAAVQKARMDSFTALDAGSTTGDAELIDARIGAKGETYKNVGAAIRTQTAVLNAKIKALDELVCVYDTYKNESDVATTSDSLTLFGLYLKEPAIVRSIYPVFNVSEGQYKWCYITSEEALGDDTPITIGEYTTMNIGEPIEFGPVGIELTANIGIGIVGIGDATLMFGGLDSSPEYTNANIFSFNTKTSMITGFSRFNGYSFGFDKIEIFNNTKIKHDLKSKWFGKKCLQLGDSITWYDGHTNTISETVKGYAGYLRDIGLTVDNKGVSGAGIAALSSHDDVSEIVDQITNFYRYDLITIAAGVNDYMFRNSPIGEFATDNFDKTVFTQAYQYVIETILAANPTVQIVLFTPLKAYTKTDANTEGLYLKDYANRIKEIGEYYSIPVLDLYSISGFNSFNIQNYTIDSLHPNNAGYKVICENKLLPFIETI